MHLGIITDVTIFQPGITQSPPPVSVIMMTETGGRGEMILGHRKSMQNCMLTSHAGFGTNSISVWYNQHMA